MSEPEGVRPWFACGPGMCDMDAATTKDGLRIFAGGAEGMVKVFEPKRRSDVLNAVAELNLDQDDTGDEGFAVTAVAVSPSGEELAVGLRNGDVKLFELPSLEFKSMLTRFTAPVLGLDYGMKDGGVIAACSEEPGIKVVRRSDNSRILTLTEMDGGVKSVQWDPRGEYLAASGFDGTVKVWKVDPSLDDLCTDVVFSASYNVKEAAGGAAELEHLGKVAWHPEGKSLGVTGAADPVMLVRGSWERSLIVPENAEDGGHMKEITIAAFCPDGRHLATAALDGRVVVWDAEEKLAVKTYVSTEQENWRHLKWLDEATLAALSISGGVCTIKFDPNTSTTKDADPDKTSSVDITSKDAGKKAAGERERGRRRESTKHLFDEEAAEDNDGNISEADTAEIADRVDDVAAGDVTAGMDDSFLDGGDGGGDGLGGDMGRGAAGDGDVLDMTNTADAVPMVPQVETTPLQDPFQPSSTPLGDARRYLCWNRVGTIISVDENTHNAVEIEFADKLAGRNQRFMDTWNFVMGALSSTGAVFASVAQEEDESSIDPSPSGGRSVLYFKGLGRHSAGEDWTRMMPAGENVLAVSVGNRWAAAATDRQLVRLFSASGLQGEIIMLPGPVVTMVGGGEVLVVVFHQGVPLGDSQNLGYQMLDVGGKRELSKGTICLSPGSELTWLGTTEEGMVVAMDSAGLLSALTRSFGWQWTPLLDTLKVSKNKKDRFWPVGVVTGKLLAATLKGGEEHSAAYPRPVLTAVPLTAICAQSMEGGETAMFEKVFPAMEARARQRKFNLDHGLWMEDDVTAQAEEVEGELMAQHAVLDTLVVKRIQEACAAEKAERAMDLGSLLHLEKSYSIAIKVANHHGLTSLAAGLEDAMVSKFHGPEDEDNFDGEGMEADDRGWARAGRSGVGGGTAASGGMHEEQNLGPLDRARLEQARRKQNEGSVPPPRRPADTASKAGGGARYDDDGGDGIASETPLGADSDGVDVVDSDDDGGEISAVIPKAAKGTRPKRRLQDAEEIEEEEEEVVEEEIEEAAGPPAPRNPFARGGRTFASPPRKKRKDVLETINDLRASPSPGSTKRPQLSRLSSFAAEARHKNRNDRNVL